MIDIKSFDYSTAQWVLSIIIGVCLTRIYRIVAHHTRYRKETVFYLPYLFLIAQTFLLLLLVWFISPYRYQQVADNNLAFLARIMTDSMAVVFTLVALPDDQILSKNQLNLKSYYHESKRTFMVVFTIWIIFTATMGIFFDPEMLRIRHIANMTITLIVVILMIKFDNDYLHAFIHLFYIVQLIPILLHSDY